MKGDDDEDKMVTILTQGVQRLGHANFSNLLTIGHIMNAKHSARQYVVGRSLRHPLGWTILGCFCMAGLAVEFVTSNVAAADKPPAAVWKKAETRGELYQEAMRRADRMLQSQLRIINPETGLVPQSYVSNSKWTVANSAADLYSSLVMVASFSDREAMNGTLRRAIVTERKHAQRIGHLPDDLDLKTLKFVHAKPSLGRSTYGASEWCRDGLLRITEILGPDTPWADRLIELADEIMARASKAPRFGRLPGALELCGEMLQTLSRLHALTGDQKYRTWAERIGDYYFFEKPPQKSTRLGLRDHGGEIISGLSEVFVMTSRADPPKAARYREPLRELLDRVLEIGQAPDGMLYNIIDPLNGKVISKGLTDPKKGINTNWGYTCNAHCSYDMVTGENRYRDRILKALRALPAHYMDYKVSGDNCADFIEQAIVLNNRFHVEGVEEWIARMIPRLWAPQKADGSVGDWYGSHSSFGRTSILCATLCSQGVRADPWREDLRLGAVASGDEVYVVLRSDKPWVGRLCFDFARSREVFHLPLNYPRINELPEWYVVSRSADYEVTFGDEKPRVVSGAALIDGLPVGLQADSEVRIIMRKQ